MKSIWADMCSMCRQPSLAVYDIKIAGHTVWVSVCSDCDAGHCPGCLRHVGPDERYCAECHVDLSLRGALTQASE